MARIAREASEGIAVCSRILADCNGYRHPRKRFERRLPGRMRGRKTRARCSPVRKERGRMPCRARVRLLKRHIQAYFPATFPIRKRRRAKTAQNSMWRCRLERNALIPLEISWRFGRCDAGRRFFAAAGTRAGKAARTPPVMRIDGHGILWPRMRLNGGKRRPAGGSAERRLCFAVASNVPFAVKAVESETREGASSALPQCADPQRFREFISSAERKLPALSRGRLHRATRYLSAAAPCRRSSAA